MDPLDPHVLLVPEGFREDAADELLVVVVVADVLAVPVEEADAVADPLVEEVAVDHPADLAYRSDEARAHRTLDHLHVLVGGQLFEAEGGLELAELELGLVDVPHVEPRVLQDRVRAREVALDLPPVVLEHEAGRVDPGATDQERRDQGVVGRQLEVAVGLEEAPDLELVLLVPRRELESVLPDALEGQIGKGGELALLPLLIEVGVDRLLDPGGIGLAGPLHQALDLLVLSIDRPVLVADPSLELLDPALEIARVLRERGGRDRTGGRQACDGLHRGTSVDWEEPL